jgi:cAMP phosphodiesterase
LINDSFLIDAGSCASALPLKRQALITDIFITHPHIDHIKDICFLIENSFFPQREPIVLRSTESILSDIHKHMFNNILWPDFTKIPVDSVTNKIILKFEPINESETFQGIKFKTIPVNHPGNAIGFILDSGESQILFTGDTGPTDLIWQEANKCENLKAIFTEISFPNRMKQLAIVSGHYTTDQLLDDLGKLKNKNIPIFIAHFKPLFFEDLMDEFYRFKSENINLLHQEDEYLFE